LSNVIVIVGVGAKENIDKDDKDDDDTVLLDDYCIKIPTINLRKLVSTYIILPHINWRCCRILIDISAKAINTRVENFHQKLSLESF